MLILTRKCGQKLIIGDNIEIVITETTGSFVRLGVCAPKNVTIYREELYKEIKKANQNSGDTSINAVSELNLKFEAANQVDPLGKLATISVKPKSKDS